MKRRNTQSFERAITQILTELGADAAAVAVGKSASLVRKWSDPDHRATPSLLQACKLDLAYTRLTGRPGPILAAYAAILNFDEPPSESDAPLFQSFLFLQASVGEAARCLGEYLSPAIEKETVSLSSRISTLPEAAIDVLNAAGTFARAARRSHHSKAKAS